MGQAFIAAYQQAAASMSTALLYTASTRVAVAGWAVHRLTRPRRLVVRVVLCEAAACVAAVVAAAVAVPPRVVVASVAHRYCDVASALTVITPLFADPRAMENAAARTAQAARGMSVAEAKQILNIGSETGALSAVAQRNVVVSDLEGVHMCVSMCVRACVCACLCCRRCSMMSRRSVEGRCPGRVPQVLRCQ